MKLSDIISVNPGKQALGHVDASASSIFRSQVIEQNASKNSLDLISLLFPTSKSGLSEYKKYDVPLRTLFATILIVTGLSVFNTPMGIHSVAFGVCTLCFGAFLALGLFTRLTMIGAAVFYCIFGALSLRAGVADMTIFSLMFGCLIFGILGAGKYSCDTLIRKGINRHKRASEIKKKDTMMSYKVFHQVKY